MPRADGKRSGRPPVDPELRREQRFGFRCSEKEAERIRTKAEAAGLTPGEFARQAALSQKVKSGVPEINREAYQQLTRIGANLNQLTKAVNSGEANLDAEVLEDLRESLRRLQAQIAGVDE